MTRWFILLCHRAVAVGLGETKRPPPSVYPFKRAVRRRGPPTPMEQNGGQKWSISGFPFLQLTLTLRTLPSLKMHARLGVRSALSLTFLCPGEGHRERGWLFPLKCFPVSKYPEEKKSIFQLYLHLQVTYFHSNKKSNEKVEVILSVLERVEMASVASSNFAVTDDGRTCSAAPYLLPSFRHGAEGRLARSLLAAVCHMGERGRKESNSVPQSTTNLPFKLF